MSTVTTSAYTTTTPMMTDSAATSTSSARPTTKYDTINTSSAARATTKKITKYQEKWSILHPWLMYDNKKKRCFAGKNNSMTVGSATFKTSSLTRHEESIDHKTVVDAPTNASEMKKAIKNALSDEDTAVKIAATVVYWMASEDIPLSKYESLITLLNTLKVDKISLLQVSQRVKYAIYYSANELLKAIDCEIDKSVQYKIDRSPNITILVDESTDISNRNRMTMNARIINPDTCAPETVFLRDVEYSDGTGEGLARVIKDEMQRRNIPSNKFLGLGTDGANVMVGSNKGVYGILKGDNPHLINIHCMAHRLALCTSQAAKDIPAFATYQEWFTSLFYYFKHSAAKESQMKEIQKILESPQLKYREVHAVRWLSFNEALSSVYRTLEPLIVYFENRKQQKDPKAVGLLKQMVTQDFFYITYMLMDVLPIVSRLCLVLQKKDLDVAYAKVAIETCIKDLELYKDGGELPFPTYLEQFSSDVKTHDESGQLQFKGHKLTVTNTNLQLLKSKFLNKLLSNLNSRFPMISLMSSFHIFGMRPISTVPDEDLDQWGNDELEMLLAHYGERQIFKQHVSEPLISKEEARREWCLLKRCVLALRYPRESMVNLWQLIAEHHQEDFPTMVKLGCLALTLPLHTADCERTFSIQNHILTFSTSFR